MDIGLLHTMCKQDTRNGFDDFKRSIAIGLFEFNHDVKKDLQTQLVQGLCSKAVKYCVTNNNLSNAQLQHLRSVTDYYTQLALTTSENYSKRFLVNG